MPLDWARAQTNLGNALQALGGRESGTARLEEAVAAYRAALQELTRERVPLQWAMTQTNLTTRSRRSGGGRAGQTARLEEAMAAYRAALHELTRERVPLQWAAIQTNLGNALQTLGERESGTARLEEAVVAYRAALHELTRERVPLQRTIRFCCFRARSAQRSMTASSEHAGKPVSSRSSASSRRRSRQSSTSWPRSLA